MTDDSTRSCPACGVPLGPSETHWSLGPEPMGSYVCPAVTVRTMAHPEGAPYPVGIDEYIAALDAIGVALAEWSDHYRTGCDHGMSAHGAKGCVDCRCTTPGFSMPVPTGAPTA